MGIFTFLWQYALLWHKQELGNLCSEPDSMYSMSSSVKITHEWDILGPFQIGTREAAWSADPLEYYGGFSTLKPEPNSTFPSSMTRDGRARWTRVKSHADERETHQSRLVVSFSDTVDWNLLQQVYGWAATQWQAWARTEILVGSGGTQTTLLYTQNILEYIIDGQRFFGGDFFAFRRAPAVLHLSPGRHTLEVRLVRDVRAMGGIGPPLVEVTIEAIPVEKPGIIVGQVLISDVIDGNLASPYGSLTITNTRRDWAVVEISSQKPSAFSVERSEHEYGRSFELAPGQTRPMAANFNLHDVTVPFVVVQLRVIAYDSDRTNGVETVKVSIPVHHASRHDIHKVTHLHPSGIVSYAMLRAPSSRAMCSPNIQGAPIMVLLHGAGVEAENALVKKAFDAVPEICAWILMPSGVTTWSGDDWHTWGHADMQASVDNIPLWSVINRWEGIKADISKILLTGHSNGGQGVWYGLSHHPDKIIAAAPLSGYVSIPLYVPTTYWRSSDPSKGSVVEFAMSSFRHDLLASNFAQIPVFQQHGELDDNVPVYHSSLMHQMIVQSGSMSQYEVVKGKGHWWENVMTETRLVEFYQKALEDPHVKGLSEVDEFELVVADPGDMSGRFGVRVLHLQEQGKLGSLKVSFDKRRDLWRIIPENIMAFELPYDEKMRKVEIDVGPGLSSFVLVLDTRNSSSRTLSRCNSSIWTTTDPAYPPTRKSSHFGGLSAILRASRSPFFVNVTNAALFPLALQVSRNFNTYFGADTEIITNKTDLDFQHHNQHSIILFVGDSLPLAEAQDSITICDSFDGSHLKFRLANGLWLKLAPAEPQATIFLRPGPLEGLEIVVWGSDLGMVEQAARLLPMMTGTGQPDWIVCRKEMMWKGLEGCDVGWFDAWWQIQQCHGKLSGD